VIALEAQLAKNIAPKKRVSTSTFKSFENDKLGTKKILHTKPQYNGLLATVLNRMSMFNNQDEIDDLTKIDGLNSAISDILKKEGLQNYKQIAMLEKEDFSLIAKVTGVRKNKSVIWARPKEAVQMVELFFCRSLFINYKRAGCFQSVLHVFFCRSSSIYACKGFSYKKVFAKN